MAAKSWPHWRVIWYLLLFNNSWKFSGMAEADGCLLMIVVDDNNNDYNDYNDDDKMVMMVMMGYSYRNHTANHDSFFRALEVKCSFIFLNIPTCCSTAPDCDMTSLQFISRFLLKYKHWIYDMYIYIYNMPLDPKTMKNEGFRRQNMGYNP